MFTLLRRSEIEAVEKELVERPEGRAAQQALAADVTARVHGDDAAKVAEAVSGVLFGGREVRTLSAKELDALGEEIPSATISNDGAQTLADLFVAAGLAPSKSRARTLLSQGGAYVNGERVGPEAVLADLKRLPGERLLLRKGARDYALVRMKTVTQT
jgi:tyrosyl-tRNA synthetase